MPDLQQSWLKMYNNVSNCICLFLISAFSPSLSETSSSPRYDCSVFCSTSNKGIDCETMMTFTLLNYQIIISRYQNIGTYKEWVFICCELMVLFVEDSQSLSLTASSAVAVLWTGLRNNPSSLNGTLAIKRCFNQPHQKHIEKFANAKDALVVLIAYQRRNNAEISSC